MYRYRYRYIHPSRLGYHFIHWTNSSIQKERPQAKYICMCMYIYIYVYNTNTPIYIYAFICYVCIYVYVYIPLGGEIILSI